MSSKNEKHFQRLNKSDFTGASSSTPQNKFSQVENQLCTSQEEILEKSTNVCSNAENAYFQVENKLLTSNENLLKSQTVHSYSENDHFQRENQPHMKDGAIDNRCRKRKPGGRLKLSAPRKKRRSFPPSSTWKTKNREGELEMNTVGSSLEQCVIETENSNTSISCLASPESTTVDSSVNIDQTSPNEFQHTNEEERLHRDNFSPTSSVSSARLLSSSISSPVAVDTSSTLCFSSSPSSLDETSFIWEKLSGRRIIDMYVFKQLWEISSHSKSFECQLNNLKFLSEVSKGLAYEWRFQCQMCLRKFTIFSDKCMDQKLPQDTIDHMPILSAAVGGVISSGNGQTVLDTILSSMEIPTISTATYTRTSDRINKIFEKAAEEEMKKAGKEEAELAIFYGDVGPDGIPNVKVVADGCWSRRSFGTNYASLGGVAAIIGARTQKVLYVGIKNKYCYRCSRDESSGSTSNSEGVKSHTCFKNYKGSSAGMEQAAILDGFMCSLSMHNIRYSHLIADGDSSVYKKILDANPYGEKYKVEKVSCKNHILRCFRRNLEKYCHSTSDRVQQLVDAKRLIKARAMRLSNAIDGACKFRAAEKNKNAIQLLRQDILNAPNHVFGFHQKCAKYFCNSENPEKNHNLIPQLQKTEALEKLNELILRVANNSDSLILNENNNKVESFNSVMCKAIAGKRVNYTGSSGYHGRSAMSVLLFNRQPPIRILHKEECYEKSPGIISTKNSSRWLRRRDKNKLEKKDFKRKLFSQSSEDYGLTEKPDMEPEIYAARVEQFMSELSITDEDRIQLEIETRGQADNDRWAEERRKRITASNFGTVCKMGTSTSSANTVRLIVANSFRGNSATQYGKETEPKAREELAAQFGSEIVECGLLIHPSYPYLGASPDGLIGDQVVEIKCPTILANKNKEEAEAVLLDGSIKCLDFNGNLKKNHNYFYQVQGQLEIADRDSAIFVIYGPMILHTQEIERDKVFWCTKMLPRLLSFYNNCLLPELVDSRLDRQRPIRAINYVGTPVVSKKKKLDCSISENITTECQ